MSEAFAQRPVFDALERYLSVKSLLNLVQLDRRLYEMYKDDFLVWYKICKGNVVHACKMGKLELVKRMYAMHPKIFNHLYLISISADNGHLDIIKWLHENTDSHCSVNAMDWAAQKGHFEIVKWLHENRKEGCTTHAMDNAAQYGHLEIFKWLHENRKEGCTSDALLYAIQMGHVEMVKYIDTHFSFMSSTALRIGIEEAAEYGHCKVLKYLDEKGVNIMTSDVMYSAVKYGYIDIVKYLNKTPNRDQCYSKYSKLQLFTGALFHGHLEIAQDIYKYMKKDEITREFIDNEIKIVSEKGYIGIVMWLESILPNHK